MVYVPGKLPLVTTDDGNAIVMYLEDELKSISSSVIDDLRAIDLRPESNPAHVLRPRQGMIVYADGVNWNPGYGENAYVRNGAGLWIPMGIPFETLYATRNWFVDNTNGNDANDGLAAGAGRAFKTLQKAANATYNLFLNGNNVNINVADGTYTAGVILPQPWFGVGTVFFIGNFTTPANCLISTTNARCFFATNRGNATLGGFRFTTTGNPADAIATYGGQFNINGKCEWVDVGANGACMSTRLQGSISLDSGAHNVSGSLGYAFIDVVQNGTIFNTAVIAFTWLANTTVSSFFVRSYGAGSSVEFPFATFTLGAFTAFGQRYSVQNLGYINTNGGGINYFPGTVAGTGTNTSVAPWGLYQ